MNLSWPSAAAACRRACWSPRLARVISFSISGLAALAFASVVLIRSCWMTSFERFISSALRCAESRLSLCRCFWWRIAELLIGGCGGPKTERAEEAGVNACAARGARMTQPGEGLQRHPRRLGVAEV